MATVPYSNFLPEVLPYAQDCPQLVAINAIRNAAIEFCRETFCWQVEATAINAVADQPGYVIVSPSDTVPIGVSHMWYDGRVLPGKSADELDGLLSWNDWRTYQGQPSYHTMLTQDTFLLVPVPVVSDPGGITLRAVVAPSRASTTFDASLFERFCEGISWGARARLYEMEGQPFADGKAALLYRSKFTGKIMETRIQINRSLVRESGTVGFRMA